jgi:serine protease Do
MPRAAIARNRVAAPAFSRRQHRRCGGVVALDINPAGLWAERGFSLGDVILEVSGKSVKTPEELGSAVSEARNAGKRSVLLRLRSGDAMRFVAAPVG